MRIRRRASWQSVPQGRPPEVGGPTRGCRTAEALPHTKPVTGRADTPHPAPTFHVRRYPAQTQRHGCILRRLHATYMSRADRVGIARISVCPQTPAGSINDEGVPVITWLLVRTIRWTLPEWWLDSEFPDLKNFRAARLAGLLVSGRYREDPLLRRTQSHLHNARQSRLTCQKPQKNDFCHFIPPSSSATLNQKSPESWSLAGLTSFFRPVMLSLYFLVNAWNISGQVL